MFCASNEKIGKLEGTDLDTTAVSLCSCMSQISNQKKKTSPIPQNWQKYFQVVFDKVDLGDGDDHDDEDGSVEEVPISDKSVDVVSVSDDDDMPNSKDLLNSPDPELFALLNPQRSTRCTSKTPELSHKDFT